MAQVAAELQFVSRDMTQPDFLRPTADSQAAHTGAGGDLPDYIGALAPATDR